MDLNESTMKTESADVEMIDVDAAENDPSARKRRGYFSELISSDSPVVGRYKHIVAPDMKSNLLWKTRKGRHVPVMKDLTRCMRPRNLAPQETWIISECQKNIVSRIVY